MVKLEEELKLYRDIAAITGDTLFKYDIDSDTMHVFGAHVLSVGSGYDINNFIKGMMNDNADILLKQMSERFVEAYNNGFPDFFDEKIKVKTKSGGQCIYRAIGKKEYDDDWNLQGIIGKLVNLGEENGSYNFHTNKNVEFTEETIQDAMKNTILSSENEKAKDNYIVSELIEEALDILTETGNIGAAVTAIMQKVGNRYNLDCVCVQEYNPKSNLSSPCIQWYDEENRFVSEKIARLPFDNFEQVYFGENNIIVVNNVESYVGDSIIINKMKNIDVKSVVVCSYSEKGKDMGWISFENHKRVNVWDEDAINTFRLVAKFISGYLLDMRSYLDLIKKEEYEKTYDSITGLPKVEFFMQEANEYIEINDGKELAVVCFGLNNLERINLVYGRDKGDEILKAFALECDKIEDRFITGCRYNANIFVALINQFDTRGNKISVAMIERINSGFERICKEKCPDIYVPIYSGITFLPNHVERLDNYISRAKQAMETAREEGNLCVFAY